VHVGVITGSLAEFDPAVTQLADVGGIDENATPADRRGISREIDGIVFRPDRLQVTVDRELVVALEIDFHTRFDGQGLAGRHDDLTDDEIG
jgi:hypothetical protein